MTAVRGQWRAVAAAGLLLWALPAGAAAQAPPAAPEDLEADVESERVRQCE